MLQSLAILVVTIGDRLGVLAIQIGQQPTDIRPPQVFLLLLPPETRRKWLHEPLQPSKRPLKRVSTDPAFLHQLLLAELKPAFHRISPSRENPFPRKFLIQNSLRYSNRNPTVEVGNARVSLGGCVLRTICREGVLLAIMQAEAKQNRG